MEKEIDQGVEVFYGFIVHFMLVFQPNLIIRLNDKSKLTQLKQGKMCFHR